MFKTCFLLGVSESNTGVGNIEDGVVFTHEEITQNPKGSVGAGDIETHHAQKAHVAIGDKVVLGSQCVHLAVKSKRKVREIGGIARHHVLASNKGLGTDGLSDCLDSIGGTGEEGRPRVHDGVVTLAVGGVTNL